VKREITGVGYGTNTYSRWGLTESPDQAPYLLR